MRGRFHFKDVLMGLTGIALFEVQRSMTADNGRVEGRRAGDNDRGEGTGTWDNYRGEGTGTWDNERVEERGFGTMIGERREDWGQL